MTEYNDNSINNLNDEADIIYADVAIIGGGPGGYMAAIRCAENGLKTVLIEKNNLGGTCLNVGCIPTKTLVSITSLLRQIKASDNYGINISSYDISLEKIRQRKNDIVASLVQGVQFLMKKNKIEVINGRAEVEKNNIISIQETSMKINYKNLVIATGSIPSKLSIPGADALDILDSNDMLELNDIPESLAIIGGGVIGMEFAFIYAALGCKVHVIEYLPQILNMLDADVVSVIKRSAKSQGIKVIEAAKAAEIETLDDGSKRLIYEKNNKTVSVDVAQVAMAVGRKANLNLDYDKIGVKLNGTNTCIPVNKSMQTSNPAIYAIGDVTHQIMLAHAASRQGIIAADHIAGKNMSIDEQLVPNAIFTYPEVGHIGVSEREAINNKIEVLVGKSYLRANSKAVAMQETDGFVKIIANKASREIIGATMVGVEATELLSILTNLVTARTTIDQASSVIYAHPTVAEAIAEALLSC